MTNDERIAWQKMLDDRQIDIAGIEFMTGEKWVPPGSVPQAEAAAPQAAPPPAAPPPDAAEWYAAINGQQQGPFNKARLGDMLKANEITRATKVWKQGIPGNNWTAMEAVEELVLEVLSKLPPPIEDEPAPPGIQPPPIAGEPAAETVPQGQTAPLVAEMVGEAAPDGMVRIEGGTFMMGSPATEADRKKDEFQHQVTVSAFYMGKYQITQRQYQAVMGANPSNFKGDNNPVEQVRWYDAVEYCNRLSQQEGLTPAYTVYTSANASYPDITWNRNANGYRLPTEAEWEYACRAGTTTAFNTGENINNNTGWYRTNSGKATHPVGRKPANAWGLYDMHGNVWEWCWDRYRSDPREVQTDQDRTGYGENRARRGGACNSYGREARSASRGSATPSARDCDLGFRVCRPAI